MTATRGCKGKVQVCEPSLLLGLWDVGEGGDGEGMVDVEGGLATSLFWGSVNERRTDGGLVDVESGEKFTFDSGGGRA